MDPRRNPRRQPSVGQPAITSASGRRLALYPSTVHAFIVDPADRLLLLRRPGQAGWEVVTSVLEPGETFPASALRGVREAAGPAFLTTYLGVLDAFTFLFDARHPPFISVCCLLRHRGGEVVPSGEVKNAEFRWWELFEMDRLDLAVPRGRFDLLTRAVDMSRFLRDARRHDDEADEDERERFP